MTDMLVKLYELENDWLFVQEQAAIGITIRKPIGPEKHLAVNWIKAHFSGAWASEFDQAISNRPITCFIAIKNERLIGFACYDATTRGFFGPTGVDESARGKGTGRALLVAALHAMRQAGYGYGIIGGVGPIAFYEAAVGATVIPDSTPGVYRGLLRR